MNPDENNSVPATPAPAPEGEETQQGAGTPAPEGETTAPAEGV